MPIALLAQSELDYQRREGYYEGIRPRPVSGFDIELISVLADYQEPADRLPEQLRVKFYLENQTAVHLIVREQDYRLFYWLDQVKPAQDWHAKSTNGFSWPTGLVLRRLDERLNMYDLGVLVRLRKETPASVEDVAPAVLYHTELPNKIAGYLFTMKINGDARLSCSMYREGMASSVMTKSYQRIPGGRPFTVRWEANDAQEATYSLVCKGYFLDSNQPIQQTVRFYQKPTVK
jgi:hypothetical protein